MATRAEAALGLARASWSIFPLHHHVGGGRCSCGDKLCTSPAKHPKTKNGLHDATSDPAQIMAWWGKWSEANIGLRTGDGVFVVDVDGEAGREFLKGRGVPETLSARTGRGVHLYFYAPEGVCVRNRAKVGPELDVRGDGGYVLAPPSEHASGVAYEWIDEDMAIADAPEWLVELVRERPAPVVDRAALPPRTDGLEAYARAALEGEMARVMDAAPGTRNDTLNTAAYALGQLVGAGALPESAAEALRDAGLAIGLSERETDLTLRSGLEAGKREPRDIPERPPRKRESPRGQGLSHSSEGDSEDGITVAEQPLTMPSSNGTRPHVEYPLGVWPSQIAEFIEATAYSVCVAPEAVGTAVLAIAASVIGRTRWLDVKGEGGWIERPGIFAGLVGDVSRRKSPALFAASDPLLKIHGEQAAKWGREHADWEEFPSKKPEPELASPLLIDVTTEVLAHALKAHPRGVGLVEDELIGWLNGMGQYKGGRGNDRQRWIKAHSGKLVDVRRVGKKPIVVENPCVSVIGGVQPDVFGGITAVNDGLAERFLYCVLPKVKVDAETPDVPRAVRGTWEGVVRALYALTEAEVVCGVPGYLVAARQRVVGAQNDAPPELEGYLGKGEMHLARIGIVLSAVWEVCCGETGLTSAGVDRAEDLWGFYAEQARLLFTEDVLPIKAYTVGSPALEAGVMRYLRSHGNEATKRDLMRGPLNRARGRDAEETVAALLAKGQIGPKPGPRKDSLVFVVLDYRERQQASTTSAGENP